MAREEFYSEVDRRMWGDAKVKQLDALEKLVWCWLLNNTQHTKLPGVFRFWAPMVADETGVPLRRVKAALAKLTELGMLRHDEKTGLGLLPNAIRRRPPRSPDNIRGWKRDFGALPECSLLHEIAQTFAKSLSDLKPEFANAWAEVAASEDRPSRITNTSTTPPETLPAEKPPEKGGGPNTHEHSHEHEHQQDGSREGAPKGPPKSTPDPAPSSRQALDLEVLEILRVELGPKFARLPNPAALVLQLLAKANVYRPNAPDRREVIRYAARAVAKAKVDNIVGLLITQVEELREEGALERLRDLEAAVGAPDAPKKPFTRTTVRKAVTWGGKA